MMKKVFAILAFVTLCFAAQDRVWSQISASGTAPSPRFDFAYAYNPTTSRFFVFGGGAFGGQIFRDFFAFNTATNTWTTLPTGPSARTDVAGAFCNGLFYIVGGKNATTTFSDMWYFSETSNTWTKIPSGLALSGGALACASTLIYLGGTAQGGAYSNKTYSYNKNTHTWSVVPSIANPVARQWTPLTYSPITDEFVLFGGWLGSSPADDLWRFYDAEREWAPINQQAQRPSKRSGHVMVYDPVIHEIFLFGGEHADGVTGLNDIWFFDPTTNIWTPVAARNQPPKGRLGAGVAYTNNNEYIIFGGVTGWGDYDDVVNDIWKLSNVPSNCVVSGSVQSTNKWTSNGVTNTQYGVSLKNEGTETAYAIDLAIVLGNSVIKSVWNLVRYGSTADFALSNFYTLAPGQTSSSAGFIAAGSDEPHVLSVSPVCYRASASIETTCGNVKVVAVMRPGSTYLQNKEVRSEYDLAVSNNGQTAFKKLAITLVSTDNVSNVASSWNIARVGTSNVYNVDVFGSLSAGQRYTNTHGFIWAGTGTFQLRCAPTA